MIKPIVEPINKVESEPIKPIEEIKTVKSSPIKEKRVNPSSSSKTKSSYAMKKEINSVKKPESKNKKPALHLSPSERKLLSPNSSSRRKRNKSK